MKAQTKARGRQGARRPTQTAPLTQMMVLDALRTWVIPTVAGVIGFAIFVLYNIELVDPNVAVIVTGGLALIVVLFYGLRGFIDESASGALLGVLVAFAALWGVATFYPLFRAVNPGVPLFSTELHRDGSPVTLPFHGQPGHYNLIVEGHFRPTEGRSNREAKYSIAIGHEGSTEHVFEGMFRQEWGSQRIGAGRRSTTVPVMRETTQHLDPIDDPDGRDLTVKLTDLSTDVGDSVRLKLYSESVPRPVLIALSVLTLAGAILIDAWRPKGESQGLLTTLTLAALLSIGVFRVSSVATPGFPQLIIAVLVGTVVGAIAATVLSRLTQPLRKYLPARP